MRSPSARLCLLVCLLVSAAACGDPAGAGGGGGGAGGGAGGGSGGGGGGSPDDLDGDGVPNGEDSSPEDPASCADADGDGCDDCTVLGASDPDDDGWDADGDGACEIVLDAECTRGANAASDPWRREACTVFALMNLDRAEFDAESGGGAQIAWSEDLWEIAVAHSENMCARGIFNHEIDGDGPSERATAAGLGFWPYENIAVNLDPSAAEYAWMNEPTCVGHRGAILHAGALEVGVGYYACDRPTDQYEWGQHHHVTADFHVVGDEADYCEANGCMLPVDPPSVAICPPQLVEWDFCLPPEEEVNLGEWGCPDD